jgi:ABC-2 type transport system permease protein
MSGPQQTAPVVAVSRRGRHGFRYVLRVLGVTSVAEYKLKYAGSALGYFWSVAKPLALFTMLYFVFGRVFKLNALSPYYPTSLLGGIVLFTFFSDATSLAMYSLVARQTLLRKLIFPRSVIPTAAVLTAGITFLVNVGAVAVFVAAKGIVPRANWLLLLPLLVELFVFVLGVSLFLSALFVRLRDVGQVWDLLLQLFFYATPIIYPVGYLPGWARKIAFLSPFTQVLQEFRATVLYPDVPGNRITAAQALGSVWQFAPVAIAGLTLLIGLFYFRRQEPWFAERV